MNASQPFGLTEPEDVSRGTSEYEIEKDVPIPMLRSGRKPGMGSGRRYPFIRMEVGDSFAYPIGDHARIHSASRHHSERHEGVRFLVSYVHGRCWRVA